MSKREPTDGAKPEPAFRTQAVHGGIEADPVTGAIAPNIVPSTNFAARFGEIGFSADDTIDDAVAFAYAREGHPTAQQLEHKLALLDGGEAAVVFASGIAAVTGLLLHKLGSGDHLVVGDVSYAGTAEFVRGMLTRRGVDVSFADLSDPSDLQSAIRPDTRLVFAETPCNPVLKLVDIGVVSEIAHSVKAELVVDSTFATPAVTRPLEHGADYVVHSLTKYYGGHGDALGGAVVGSRRAMDALRCEVGVHLGATLSPFNAWLILRGVETLPIRMAAYSESAQRVAEFLEAHPAVDRVRFPGLPSHPQYDLARRQMRLPSGMIAFHVPRAEKFGEGLADSLSIFHFAASLGHSHSLILYCDTEALQRTTFRLDDEHLQRYVEFAGSGFFRLSIGLEDPRDLCRDLERALTGVAPAATRAPRAAAR